MAFHLVDVYDIFPQYRLHTPAEVLKRNHVSRWHVFRDVIIQQVIQTIFGLGLALLDEEATYGMEEYSIASWALWIRKAQRYIPVAVSLVGLDAGALASKLVSTHPIAAGVISGGKYPWLVQLVSLNGQSQIVPAFAPWEMLLAKAMYWLILPGLQFFLGIVIVDTWQYFLHRAMHMNKWMYATFHSRHHKLYVPYAYGALYNHPFEGFLLDTLGTGLAYLVSGMTVRQSMWFFTCSTIKTVDDHCGYSLPFDPLQLITSNNAAYHDIHHQSWGIKTNFSQPFFTIWDRVLDTMFKGGDVTSRYEKSRLHAQHKVDRDNGILTAQSDSMNSSSASEYDEAKKRSPNTPVSVRRTTRKKATSISQQSAGNLKGLRNKMNESLQGRGGNVLGVESGH